MRLFAIGDLHLPGGQEKPMDVFGKVWKDHTVRIREAWCADVGPDDAVLLPGDLSWAMRLEEAAADLAYLGGLPGRIVMIRGNHDYWWQSIGKVRRALPANVAAIQNDHVALGIKDWAVCGTRGWALPGSEEWGAQDDKVFQREVQRLEFSLKSAQSAGCRSVVCMLHYPPAPADGRATPFTELLETYGVRLCVYGHLHGRAARRAVQGEHRGVQYRLAACDAIGFRPLHLLTL